MKYSLPQILQDEDGIISLEWKTPARTGVVIVFNAGDDDATFSWREPGHYYSETGIEFKLSNGLPAEAQAIFHRIIEEGEK
jgi:hypothetical protein